MHGLHLQLQTIRGIKSKNGLTHIEKTRVGCVGNTTTFFLCEYSALMLDCGMNEVDRVRLNDYIEVWYWHWRSKFDINIKGLLHWLLKLTFEWHWFRSSHSTQSKVILAQSPLGPLQFCHYLHIADPIPTLVAVTHSVPRSSQVPTAFVYMTLYLLFGCCF